MKKVKKWQGIVDCIVDDWIEFKGVVFEFRESSDRNVLFSASEENYSSSGDRIQELNNYVDELSNKSNLMQVVIFVDIIFLAVIIIKILFTTHKELQENKKLS